MDKHNYFLQQHQLLPPPPKLEILLLSRNEPSSNRAEGSASQKEFASKQNHAVVLESHTSQLWIDGVGKPLLSI